MRWPAAATAEAAPRRQRPRRFALRHGHWPPRFRRANSRHRAETRYPWQVEGVLASQARRAHPATMPPRATSACLRSGRATTSCYCAGYRCGWCLGSPYPVMCAKRWQSALSGSPPGRCKSHPRLTRPRGSRSHGTGREMAGVQRRSGGDGGSLEEHAREGSPRERERVARGASPAAVAHTRAPCLRRTVCLHTDARAHTHLRAALGQGLFQGTRRLACAGDVGLECRYLVCTRARQRTCGPSGPADDSQTREEALQAAAPSQGRSSLWELVTYDTRGHGALQCCAATCAPAVASSHLAPGSWP